MKINTLIEHKEVVVVCEESGPISMSYNVLLTTLKANARIKPIGLAVIVKLALEYTNYGKTSHSMETCHNRKREVLVVPTATVKSTELVARTKPNLLNQEKYMFIIHV
jgi:hypothetical protein